MYNKKANIRANKSVAPAKAKAKRAY